MSTVAVVPVNDLVEHDDFSDDCICGPTWELVPSPDDGPDGWLLTHHSLDGRESHEADS